VFLVAFAFAAGVAAHGQKEGSVPTQALVAVDTDSTAPITAEALTVTVNDHQQPLSAWQQVEPANAQVALLLDGGLRASFGREMVNLRAFVSSLAPGVEVLIGYMQYGHVVVAQPFTTDHALAASTVHMPEGNPGMSASPYVCLTDFLKYWSGSGAVSSATSPVAAAHHKTRYVLMITDGVDPYNGNAGVMNQGSPYVDGAIAEAQRAGIPIYAIYFGDAGIVGGIADNSGQTYLSQITQATGGVNYFEGLGNPVSTTPYLQLFQSALAESYIATFNAPAAGNGSSRDLVDVKFDIVKPKKAPKSKSKIKGPKVPAVKTILHAPQRVRPGNAV
jgi:hypothetical protein